MAAPLRSQGSQRLVDIVYGVDYQGIYPVCSPRFRTSVSVSVQVVAFATGVPSYIYAFHRLQEFHHLYRTRSVVLDAVQVERGFHQLAEPPTRALRPVISINAAFITAAAGTKLAGAYSVGNVKTARY